MKPMGDSMHGLRQAGVGAALLLTACSNHTVNFDQLPGGAAVPSWDGTSTLAPGNPSVITTEYAADGVASIRSTGGGVVALGGQNPPSQPNVACPFGSSGLVDFSQPTRIDLAESTGNIWVSIPVANRLVSVTAFDASGNLLETQSSDGPEVSIVNGARRVHIAHIGIIRVELAGTQYCFDDFTWQETAW